MNKAFGSETVSERSAPVIKKFRSSHISIRNESRPFERNCPRRSFDLTWRELFQNFISSSAKPRSLALSPDWELSFQIFLKYSDHLKSAIIWNQILHRHNIYIAHYSKIIIHLTRCYLEITFVVNSFEWANDFSPNRFVIWLPIKIIFYFILYLFV